MEGKPGPHPRLESRLDLEIPVVQYGNYTVSVIVIPNFAGLQALSGFLFVLSPTSLTIISGFFLHQVLPAQLLFSLCVDLYTSLNYLTTSNFPGILPAHRSREWLLSWNFALETLLLYPNLQLPILWYRGFLSPAGTAALDPRRRFGYLLVQPTSRKLSNSLDTATDHSLGDFYHGSGA